MMKAEISIRVNRRIGSLRWAPYMERNVLRHIREQTKPEVHYRLSVVLALVLLMILLLATATAALLGWRPFAARVLELEPGSAGGFPGWSLESKLALVEEMRAADMDMSLFSGYEKLTPEQRDTWLNERLRQAWSGELAYASGNILEKIRGPFYAWSLDDKAWFSQKLIENNRLGEADEINLMPGPADYSKEEATQKAECLLLVEYPHINQDTLHQLVPAVYYYRLQEKPEFHYWKVEYRDEYGSVLYAATFKADGSSAMLTRVPTKEETAAAARQSEQDAAKREAGLRRLEAQKGDPLYWSLQDKAESFGNKLPGPDDLSLEEARKLAKEALVSHYAISAADVEALPWGVYFTEYQTESLGYADYYAFTFVVDEMNKYSVGIDAKSGDIVLIQGPGEGNG